MGQSFYIYEDKTMWKRMMTVFCLIMAVVLVGLFAVEQKQAVNKAQELVALNTQIQQLQTEKKALEQELEKITGRDNADEKTQPIGLVCFTSVNQSLFTQAYPQLQLKGCSGVFIMQDGKLPGDYNTITVEECLELLDAGWSYGISIKDGAASEAEWQLLVQEYLSKMRERIGVSPSVYCFLEGRYSAESVAFLEDNEITTILYQEKEKVKAVEGALQIPLYGYLDALSGLDAGVVLGLEVQIDWDEDTEDGVRYSIDSLSDVLEDDIVAICELSTLQMIDQEERKVQAKSRELEIDALQERISAIEEDIKGLYR